MRNRDNEVPGAEEARVIEARIQELERQHTGDKKRDEEYKQRQLRFNKLLVVFTAALFLTSVCADLIMFFQVRAAKLSADATTSAARTAEQVRIDSQKSFTGTLEQMKGQTGAAKKSAEAAQKAANAAASALKSSQEWFRLEQRPYLTVDGPQFLEPPAADKGVKANVTFRAIGRTPAISASVFRRFVRVPESARETDFPPFIESLFKEVTVYAAAVKDGDASVTRQDVAPGGSFFSTGELLQGPLSIDEMRNLVNGKIALLYLGIAKYRDSFNGRFETEFCFYYFGADPKIWHFCPIRNAIR